MIIIIWSNRHAIIKSVRWNDDYDHQMVPGDKWTKISTWGKEEWEKI